MTPGSVRLGIAAVALILVWIVVYWWTPATPEVSLEFDHPPQRFAPPEPPAGIAATVPTTPSLPPAKEAEPPPQPAVIPPSFILYSVQRGDTAERISQKVYGTSEHWKSVMQANPMADFQRLKEGRIIRVPQDPKNVQGVPGSKRAKAPAKVPTPESADPVSSGIEYLVESGDTLTGIAARFYGRASAWTLIRDANLEKLGEDGKNLRSGMKITLPAAPDGAKP